MVPRPRRRRCRGGDRGGGGRAAKVQALPHERESETDLAEVVLGHLRTADVQQAHKEGRILFTNLAPWPGGYVGAEGRFTDGEREQRAAILIDRCFARG